MSVRARSQLRFLAAAGEQLDGPLTGVTDVLTRVSRLVVPRFADSYVLTLRQADGQLRVAAQARADSTSPRRVAEMTRGGTWDCCGRAHLAPLETGSGMCVPLALGQDSVGGMLLARARPHAYAQSDLDSASELGRRVAVLVRNARQYEALRVALDQQNDLLMVAAHELRTPLTALAGYAHLLLRRFERGDSLQPHELQQALVCMDDQTQRLCALVGSLFDAGRLESGRLALQREQADVRTLVFKVVDLLATARPDRPISVDAPVAVTARVDVVRLEQVLLNLLDNAMKFSPAGSEITVGLQAVAHGLARLSVRDRGMGVPAHLRERIFDRFVQGSPEAQTGGMGLGLYLARQIVEAHGGRLYAEFPAEGGARFVVELTLLRPAPLAATREFVHAPPGLRAETTPLEEVASDHA